MHSIRDSLDYYQQVHQLCRGHHAVDKKLSHYEKKPHCLVDVDGDSSRSDIAFRNHRDHFCRFSKQRPWVLCRLGLEQVLE